MSKLRDDFLDSWCDIFGIDPHIPLRLQKRELLKCLGFTNAPADFGLCRCTERVKVSRSFAKASKNGYPFFVVVSEKWTSSIIPPLFIVRGIGDILYRNTAGIEHVINEQEMFNEITSFGEGTWLEFVRKLWGEETFAGRLLYHNTEMQTLELQKGVRPAQIPDARNKQTFIGTTSLFMCSSEWYETTIGELSARHFSHFVEYEVVSSILRMLKRLSDSFEQLCAIGPMPTLEFAYVEGRILAIDIDWPTQWEE